MDALYLITGNEGKLREAKAMIPKVEGLNIDLTEIQSLDAEEIIRHKLGEARKKHSGEFIVEDTSLYLDSLNGLPGPLIKWFLKSIGNDGIVKLSEMHGEGSASAKCLVGYSHGDKIRFFSGVVKGKIVAPRGENGFGWDKIFQPDGYDKTFAEMNSEEKNMISPRKLALECLKRYLNGER